MDVRTIFSFSLLLIAAPVAVQSWRHPRSASELPGEEPVITTSKQNTFRTSTPREFWGTIMPSGHHF